MARRDKVEDARLAGVRSAVKPEAVAAPPPPPPPPVDPPLRTWRVTWADPERAATEITAHNMTYGMDPITPTVFASQGGKRTVLAAHAWLLIEEVEPPSRNAPIPAGDPVGRVGTPGRMGQHAYRITFKDGTRANVRADELIEYDDTWSLRTGGCTVGMGSRSAIAAVTQEF